MPNMDIAKQQLNKYTRVTHIQHVGAITITDRLPTYVYV